MTNKSNIVTINPLSITDTSLYNDDSNSWVNLTHIITFKLIKIPQS